MSRQDLYIKLTQSKDCELPEKGVQMGCDPHFNRVCLLIIVIVYLGGQFLIGAFSPVEKGYFPKAIFHMDFLNYASILKQFFSSFPPPNPNFGGMPLTQSWLHHIPCAVLTQFISPILSIRIFNMLWIIAFILIIRRYFPHEFGILTFLLLCISTPGWSENPLGIDLIIRSFHHTPFFLFLFIALFEKNKAVRYAATFLLPWFHGYLSLSIFPFFIVDAFFKRNREKWDRKAGNCSCFSLFSLLFLTLGLYTYSSFLTRFAAQSAISILWQKVFFKPREPIIHILPFIPFLIFAKEKRWWIMIGVGFILSSLIQWNNYYFIFILNLAIALTLIDGRRYFSPILKHAFGIVIIILFIFFIDDLFHKYNPRSPDPYRAYINNEFRPALDWISKNTNSGDIFLIYPPDNIEDIPFIQEIRPVYLGWEGFAGVLGLPGKERKEKVISFYRGKEIKNSVKYIFYGTLEKRHFTDFPLLDYPAVYEDNLVTIYKNE